MVLLLMVLRLSASTIGRSRLQVGSLPGSGSVGGALAAYRRCFKP
jgi:hypothetical protein